MKVEENAELDLEWCIKDIIDLIKLFKFYVKDYTHDYTNYIYGYLNLMNSFFTLRLKRIKETWNILINVKYINDCIINDRFKKGKLRQQFFNAINWILNTDNKNILINKFPEIIISIKNEVNDFLVNEAYIWFLDYCPDITFDEFKNISDNAFDYDDIWTYESFVWSVVEKNNIDYDISKAKFFEKYPEFKELENKHWLTSLLFNNWEFLKRGNRDWLYYKDYFIYFDELYKFEDIHRYFIPVLLSLWKWLKDKIDTKIRLDFVGTEICSNFVTEKIVSNVITATSTRWITHLLIS